VCFGLTYRAHTHTHIHSLSLSLTHTHTEALSNNEDAIVRFGIRRDPNPALISVVIVRTPLSVSSSSVPSLRSSVPLSAAPTATPTAGLGGGLGAGAGMYSAADSGCMHESWHTYEWNMSLVWMSHVVSMAGAGKLFCCGLGLYGGVTTYV